MIYKNIDLHASVFCNVSEDMAKEYIDYRIGKKKPLTQGAFNRAVNQATKCVCSPDEAIQLTIDKGWDGVTPEYIAAELGRRFEAAVHVTLQPLQMKKKTVEMLKEDKSTRGTTIQQDLKDRSWAN